MLVAVCVDANKKVFTLAWAIVDDESTEAWTWFFQLLDRHIFSKVSEKICLISDRGKGIINAFRQMREFTADRVVHRYCLRHVCSNLNSKFKSHVLKDLAWRAGAKHQIHKLNAIIDETKSHNLGAYNYLNQIDKGKWTRAYDGGWRSGLLTTNMSEAINGSMKYARKLPITAIVEATFHKAVKLFRDWIANADYPLSVSSHRQRAIIG